MTNGKRKVVLGITGASGVIYGLRALTKLANIVDEIYVIASKNVPAVMGIELPGSAKSIEEFVLTLKYPRANIHICDPASYFESPASGSFFHSGMLVAPCSMGTLGRIASGVSDDLMCRAADVCLKERRKLVLMARETPLSLIHLRNMVTVTEAGAVVLPAVPSFYHPADTMDELVDTVVNRAIMQLGFEQVGREWMQDRL